MIIYLLIFVCVFVEKSYVVELGCRSVVIVVLFCKLRCKNIFVSVCLSFFMVMGDFDKVMELYVICYFCSKNELVWLVCGGWLML